MSSGAGPSRQPAPDGERRRVYQEWNGAEVFFCGGRCMTGPSWKSLFGTVPMIVVPAVVFWALIIPKFASNLGLAVGLGAGALVLVSACISFLFITACSDPGVLPRNREPDQDFLAGKKPRTTEVMVNGHKVLVRYNETCGFYQPPRAHHCSVNDNCIERFDHHCPWVGTTVGKRNYRFFLLFVFTTTILCIYVFGVCLYQLFFIEMRMAAAPDAEDANYWLEALKESIPALVIMAYCFILFWFVGGLSGFHTYLVSTNQITVPIQSNGSKPFGTRDSANGSAQTTYENFRYSHDSRPNPYNQGCWANCAEVFCQPIPKPKVLRRTYIDELPPMPPPDQDMARVDQGSNGNSVPMVNGSRPAHSQADPSHISLEIAPQ